MAPISAVPSEEPRLCAAPWSPPASDALSSPTDDITTFPSCETIRPTPAAEERERDRKGRAVEVRIDRGHRPDQADEEEQEADPDDSLRRDAIGRARPDDGGDHHRDRDGQELDPGLERVVADHELEVERQDEERPRHEEVGGDEHREAAAKLRDLQHSRAKERLASPLFQALFPAAKEAEEDDARRDDEGNG